MPLNFGYQPRSKFGVDFFYISSYNATIMFAVIQTGGKQYRVEKGSQIKVERLTDKNVVFETQSSKKQTEKVVFDKVLLRGKGNDVEIGTPFLKGVAVEAKFLGEKREKKKIVFRYHNKTRYHKKKGHRQTHALVEITKV